MSSTGSGGTPDSDALPEGSYSFLGSRVTSTDTDFELLAMEEEPLLIASRRHSGSVGAGLDQVTPPTRRNSSGGGSTELPPPQALSTPQPGGGPRFSDRQPAAWHSAPPAGRGLRRSSSPGLAPHTDGKIGVAALDIEGGECGGGKGGGLRRSASGRRLSVAATDAGRCGDPTLWGSALIAVAGLALALAWFITSAVMHAPAPSACIRYTATSCLFNTDASQPFQPPACSPQQCTFNADALRCPFAVNGTFQREVKAEPDAACEDPFLEGARRPLMPPCQAACCDGDLPGGFLPGSSSLPGAQQWQPRRPVETAYKKARKPRCSFFQYTASEVLNYMQSSRVRVLVVGDSLQKQLHTRLVHMFRGTHSPIVDYRIPASARYSLCRAADSFAVAPGGYDRSVKGKKPREVLAAVAGFFGRPPSAPGCDADDRAVAVDSIFSAWFEWQVPMVQAYRAAMARGERLVLIIAVNAAEKGREVPLEWLQYLDSIRKEVKVILVASPTGGIASQETRSVLSYRNRLLRTWAASIPAISYVDFDAMSKDEHHPPPCGADIHWMCWLRWGRKQGGNGTAEEGQPADGENVLRDRRFGVPVAGLHTTADGACTDEMNRNLWQIIFNVFMKWRPPRQ